MLEVLLIICVSTLALLLLTPSFNQTKPITFLTVGPASEATSEELQGRSTGRCLRWLCRLHSYVAILIGCAQIAPFRRLSRHINNRSWLVLPPKCSTRGETMFERFFRTPAALARHTDAPFAVERARYITYCLETLSTSQGSCSERFSAATKIQRAFCKRAVSQTRSQ
jgi:hypothetical protein